MIRTAGKLLVAIAAIHFVFGLVAYFGPLSAVARDGFWNSVDPHDDRQEAFWFVVFAFPVLFLGQLLAARRKTPSRSTLALLGWELFAFALAGAVLMPVSGFWLFLLPGFFLLSAARRRPPASVS